MLRETNDGGWIDKTMGCGGRRTYGIFMQPCPKKTGGALRRYRRGNWAMAV